MLFVGKRRITAKKRVSHSLPSRPDSIVSGWWCVGWILDKEEIFPALLGLERVVGCMKAVAVLQTFVDRVVQIHCSMFHMTVLYIAGACRSLLTSVVRHSFQRWGALHCASARSTLDCHQATCLILSWSKSVYHPLTWPQLYCIAFSTILCKNNIDVERACGSCT